MNKRQKKKAAKKLALQGGKDKQYFVIDSKFIAAIVERAIRDTLSRHQA